MNANLGALFVGANPNLFYGSLTCIVVGIVLWVMVKLVVTSLIERRINALPLTEDLSPVYGLGQMGSVTQMHQRHEERCEAIQQSVGFMSMANTLCYGCGFIGLVGVVGMIVYLAQRFNVV